MNLQERDFATMVRDHKSTIYTVCYMFSKDQDEVNDSSTFGKDTTHSRAAAMCAHGSIASA